MHTNKRTKTNTHTHTRMKYITIFDILGFFSVKRWIAIKDIPNAGLVILFYANR